MSYDKFEELASRNQLHAFLRQSLNTELVITILKGITILAASTSDNIDHMNVEDSYRIRQTTTIELQKLKIAHAREFFINKEGKAVDEVSERKSQVSETA